MAVSCPQMWRVAQMPAYDVDELRVTLGGPDRGRLPDGPDQRAEDPEPQPQGDGSRERPIGDSDRPRRAAEQDDVGQRAMNRREEARRVVGIVCAPHQTSAPPEKEKNDRKKPDAANAIDRPNTIWISLRKPPAVSPKASDRPVTVMMMT